MTTKPQPTIAGAALMLSVKPDTLNRYLDFMKVREALESNPTVHNLAAFESMLLIEMANAKLDFAESAISSRKSNGEKQN
jgi:hypothetical protein